MSLICVDTVRDQCVDTGDAIQKEALELGECLPQERLKELVEPLVETFVREAEAAAQQERDEAEAEALKRDYEYKRGELAAEKRQEVEDTCVVTRPDGSCFEMSTIGLERMDLGIDIKPPEYDVNDLDNEELLGHHDWDDYKSFATLKDDELSQFVHRDASTVFEYLADQENPMSCMSLLHEINDKSVLRYNWYLPPLLKVLDKVAASMKRQAVDQPENKIKKRLRRSARLQNKRR